MKSILTTDRVNRACHSFTIKYIPGILKGDEALSPTCVEITRWLQIFTRSRGRTALKDNIHPSVNTTCDVHALCGSMRRLRNSNAHCNPHPISEVLKWLKDGATLAALLRDLDAAVKIMRMAKALQKHEAGIVPIDVEDSKTQVLELMMRQQLDLRNKSDLLRSSFDPSKRLSSSSQAEANPVLALNIAILDILVERSVPDTDTSNQSNVLDENRPEALNSSDAPKILESIVEAVTPPYTTDVPGTAASSTVASVPMQSLAPTPLMDPFPVFVSEAIPEEESYWWEEPPRKKRKICL